MSKKLSFNEAAKIMRSAKLEPVEDYPGNKLPWKCKCMQCGKLVTPSLGAVRNNGGGCRDCGLRKSAKSRLVDEKTAIKIMLKAGVVPIKPYSGSNKPWLCKCKKCKKEITPTFGNVKAGTKACAYCAKKKVHPDDAFRIMKSANLEPLVDYPGSNKRWKCKHLECGQIVYTMLSTIVAGGGGCKKCGYIKSGLKGRVSEKTAVSKMQSIGLTPLIPYPGAHKPWKSKCLKCKQIVTPHYSSIASGTGCGVCAGKIVSEELAVKIMRKAKLEPLVPYPGSKTNWKCKCLKCGQIVYPKYGDVNQGDGGCKYCGGNYVEPDAAVELMKLKGLIPQTPYVTAGKKWDCICIKCKRKVSPTYNQIQQGQSGCAYCARRKVDPKEAINVMIKAGVTPISKFPGANKPWRSKCNKCGMVVNPFYSPVANQGSNPCGYCAGKKVDPKTAFQLMLNAGLTPLEKYKGAGSRWRCTCNKCRKIVTPTYSAIRIGQGGCRYCTNKGLDYNASAFLYLMTHQEFRAHKVGVGNHKTRNNRIKEHIKTGWILINSKDFATGDEAFNVEQKTLIWLRETKSLGIYLSKAEMPQGGETETVDATEIDLPTIWAKVEELSRVKK